MNARRGFGWAVAVLSCQWFVAVSRAEVTALRGSAQVALQEYRAGEPGANAAALHEFPGDGAQLPLQVWARLVAEDDEDAAAAIAAQLADPLDGLQPNPEELAVNLALSSITAGTRYTAEARVEETREVLFRPEELRNALDGQRRSFVGQVFLDGALVIFSDDGSRDLTGAQVSVNLRVVRQAGTQPEQTVFEGRVELVGGPDGSARAVTGGRIPENLVRLVGLPLLAEEFGAFHVLVLPNLRINYAYSAVVSQPFELRAILEVNAANLEDGVGVAAVIGAPTDTIRDVIALTRGVVGANKVLTTLEQQRTEAKLANDPPALLLPGACGLFGLESLALLGLLGGLRFVGSSRGRRRTGG